MLIAVGAQGGNHQGLCLTTREKHGAMGTGQNAVTNRYGTNGACVTPVDAGLAAKNLTAHHLGLKTKEGVIQQIAGRCRKAASLDQGSNLGFNAGVNFFKTCGTSLLVAQFVGVFEGGLGKLGDFGNHGLVLRLGAPLPLGLTRLFDQAINGINGSLHLLVTIDHRAQHDVLGELVGLGLHHKNRRLGAGNHQVHLGVGHVGGVGTQDVLTVNVANAGCTNGAIERNTRNRKCSRGANHGGNVGVDFWVKRHDRANHLHFVVKTLGKKRTQGTIDKT